jgi:cellulose synthase/poly-beta-1,6-N-acetylglucosamine synthase-like glycosyltransferase/exo-beta-1,3-glucanase (GH17 family)
MGVLFRIGLILLALAVTALGWWAADAIVTPPDAKLYGVAYQPYRPGQGPGGGDLQPSHAEVAEDIALLAPHIRSIRTYTALGVGGWVVAEAERSGLTVMQGVWIDRDPDRRRAEIEAAVVLARSPVVTSLVVGSESLLRHDIAVEDLIGLAQEVRARTGKPVTTAEPWDVWIRNPRLAETMDFIAIHVLPYWEHSTTANALDTAKRDIEQLRRAFPGKRVVVGETGWPGGGKAWWNQSVGVVEEAAFVRGIFAWLQQQGIEGHVMEAFDSLWKYSIEGSPGAYWGVWTAGREQKFPLTGPVESLPDWPLYAAVAGGLGLCGALLAARRDDRRRGRALKTAAAFVLANGGAALALLTSRTYFTPGGMVTWAVLLMLLAAVAVVLAGDVLQWAGILDRPARHHVANRDTPAPVVSIHLPTHCEPPEVVIATLRSLARLDWPRRRLEVIVIDNNTPDDRLWRPVEEECALLNAQMSAPVFRFLHRMAVSGYKAGALDIALAETRADAEVVAVLDADYVVHPDWLRATAPLFLEDGRLGFVQAPQDHRDPGASPFKGWIARDYDAFFHIGMVERDKIDAIILHGTMCLVRKSALLGIGGWRARTITEDAELGLRLHAAGWTSAYVRRSLGRGLMPDDWAAFAAQRYRWAYGGMRIAIAHRRLLFGRGGLSAAQRWAYVAGWFPWAGDALGLALAVGGLLWTAAFLAFPLRLDLPPAALVATTQAAFLFRFLYGLAMHRARVPCRFSESLRAMIAGAALAPTVGLAMLHAALAPDMPFRRTPKAAGRTRLGPALRSVRLEAALATALLAGAAIMLWSRWWDPAAVCWGLALLLSALPPAAAIFLSVRAAFPGQSDEFAAASRIMPEKDRRAEA